MSISLVVDADGHCQEPEEGLAPWMPRELADRVPRRIKDNLGQSRILLEGRVWAKSEGLGPGVSGPFAPHIVGSRPGMRDPQQRLVDMNQEGIDVAVIFGTSIALTVNGLQDRTLAGAICHAVNGWLLDRADAHDRRGRVRPLPAAQGGVHGGRLRLDPLLGAPPGRAQGEAAAAMAGPRAGAVGGDQKRAGELHL